ncbi:MAG: F0F1 ATP synthase subunit delta [Candidatus Woykebacteria bacterium]
MKINKKEVAQRAKQLYSTSFVREELDIKKIRENINMVKKTFKSRALEVLKQYLYLIKKHLNNDTLVIESAQKLPTTFLKQIEKHYSKKAGRKIKIETDVNPEIIGGLRLRLGNNEWDYSTIGRINQLKEALRG